MICYLLFPEVLFHCSDWHDGESEIMKACEGFLQHGHRFFNLLFKPFSHSFYIFIAFCFCCCVIVVETYISGQSEREALLRAACLLPRALVGRPCRKKKKNIVGDPAKIALQIEAACTEGASSALKNVPPVLRVGGEWRPTRTPSFHALLCGVWEGTGPQS